VRRLCLPSLILLIGLGVVAGAVLPESLRAQVPVSRDTVRGRRDTLPTRVDSARARAEHPPEGRDTIRIPLPSRADSILRRDSTKVGAVPLPGTKSDSTKPPRDTIKAPLARAEAPPIIEIGPARIYDRAAMFATGALTLSDLLGRVPGLTELTTGWIGAPSAVAVLGDVRRVRLFLDGVELDPLDPRMRGAAAPNDLPLHALEELRIERGPDEVRVYARSWRVDRTTPYTRADVSTGDQNTNLYRAFFGRRFAHGEVFQLAAEQYNTQPVRALPSTDALHVMLRGGIARGPWKADLFAERTDRNRGPWVGIGNFARTIDTIPELESRRTTAYARFANGDPERGRWIQLMASANGYHLSARSPNTFGETTNQGGGIPDSTVYEGQYLVAGGTRYGPFSVSTTERLRASNGRRWFTPSARASMETDLLAVSLLGEGASALTPSRIEATARVQPFGRIALLASASHTGSGVFERVIGDTLFGRTINAAGVYQPGPVFFYPGFDSLEVARYELPSATALRLEGGVRLWDFWVSGGIVRRAATTLLPPGELVRDTTSGTAVRTEGEATGSTVSVRGRLFKAVHADAWALAWNDTTALYRPRYQSRSELYVQTPLLGRFPRGNFGLLASLAHEYRSRVLFAQPDGSVRVAPDARTLAFKLEIRIQTAVISYQFRNLLQERYSLVPGFPMPRQTQFYGVRWEFWN
jgi:hypothetical protein